MRADVEGVQVEPAQDVHTRGDDTETRHEQCRDGHGAVPDTYGGLRGSLVSPGRPQSEVPVVLDRGGQGERGARLKSFGAQALARVRHAEAFHGCHDLGRVEGPLQDPLESAVRYGAAGPSSRSFIWGSPET